MIGYPRILSKRSIQCPGSQISLAAGEQAPSVRDKLREIAQCNNYTFELLVVKPYEEVSYSLTKVAGVF